MFMTVVVTSYIIVAPEGFLRFFGEKDIAMVESMGIIIGVVLSALFTIIFFKSNKNKELIKA